MRRSPSRRAAIAGVLFASLQPAQALAQIAVYDPSNYASNVLQAARALEQINNQVRSLQNQTIGLINQARHLAQLPYSALETIQSNLSGIRDLMARAQRIAYDVEAIEQNFARNYQTPAALSDLELLSAASARWANSAAAFKDALTVQAGIVSTLPATQAQISALTGASQSATGMLQAAQAGNQLLALQSQQLAELGALVAAQGRAEALREADRQASRAQAREQFERFVGRGEGYAPQTVELFR